MSKKSKFLSLLLQFSPEETKTSRRLSEMRHSSSSAAAADTSSFQLSLFPLHPENQVEDREIHEHENVAYFFSTADGGATTLTGLLDTAVATVSNSSNTADSSRPDDLSPSASLTYAYGKEDSEKRAALVRNALKSRERDSSEDKWVCYSEVVERKLKEEEVTSSAVDLRRATGSPPEIHRLSLKLDYEEILNAWSDKGSLYIHAENSQIVPDITDDFLFHEKVSKGCHVGSFAVPEIENDEMRLRMCQREASVLRYKAKRRNRLFSNKIRYQVRKLNAEKRPRLKGRFVKRS